MEELLDVREKIRPLVTDSMILRMVFELGHKSPGFSGKNNIPDTLHYISAVPGRRVSNKKVGYKEAVDVLIENVLQPTTLVNITQDSSRSITMYRKIYKDFDGREIAVNHHLDHYSNNLVKGLLV